MEAQLSYSNCDYGYTYGQEAPLWAFKALPAALRLDRDWSASADFPLTPPRRQLKLFKLFHTHVLPSC